MLATEKSSTTAGVGRQVRHAGIFTQAFVPTSVRQKNKEVAQEVAAAVSDDFLFICVLHRILTLIAEIFGQPDPGFPSHTAHSPQHVLR